MRPIYLTIILILIFTPAAVHAAEAEPERSIYIGDIVTLQIEMTNTWAGGARLTEDDLRGLFADFDIVDIKRDADTYELSLRTFETGEHRVLVGGKEIVIVVRSALEDMDAEDIIEAASYVLEPGFYFRWRALWYAALVIFAGAVCCKVVFMIIKRRRSAVDPRLQFLTRAGALDADDANYFVYLTLYLKEYIGGVYQRRIIGKTSSEITGELRGIPELGDALPEVADWLTICDGYKFRGLPATVEQKWEHNGKLRELVIRIDETRLASAVTGGKPLNINKSIVRAGKNPEKDAA